MGNIIIIGNAKKNIFICYIIDTSHYGLYYKEVRLGAESNAFVILLAIRQINRKNLSHGIRHTSKIWQRLLTDYDPECGGSSWWAILTQYNFTLKLHLQDCQTPSDILHFLYNVLTMTWIGITNGLALRIDLQGASRHLLKHFGKDVTSRVLTYSI